MRRSESVPTPPAPFRHPYFESPREKQATAFCEEVAEYLRRADALRARLATSRVLESVH